MASVTERPPSDNAPWPNNPRRSGRGVLLAFGVLTVINLTATGWLALHRPPTPVTFDMKGTIDRFMEQSARQSLAEPQSKRLVTRFTQALDDSLTAWQHDHRALILVSPSVVRGADDITLLIQQDIATRMREPLPLPADTLHEGAQ